ncbi:hypothetical protein Halru_0245 [Halovivax ruber XH-70]|uniref:Uncharacterized protein n=1 Tax=Halovivax ruber (strain DSM 18193 / JCM 13892 / XH-70) TaxID=797302 RepID=L0I9I7_HALRX|nr:hypothetical protein Halru_0245 [Halovivax ruber XH-70]
MNIPIRQIGRKYWRISTESVATRIPVDRYRTYELA